MLALLTLSGLSFRAYSALCWFDFCLLIAGCKYKMLTCKSCKDCDENASHTNQSPNGQSFVFTGINQPIVFNGATVVQYIPPHPVQESTAANPAHLHPVLSYCGVASSSGSTILSPDPPLYHIVYPLDNPAFTEDENCPSYLVADTRDERSDGDPEDPEEILEEDTYDNFSLPPYKRYTHCLNKG